jgi:hypothetical protein
LVEIYQKQRTVIAILNNNLMARFAVESFLFFVVDASFGIQSI